MKNKKIKTYEYLLKFSSEVNLEQYGYYIGKRVNEYNTISCWKRKWKVFHTDNT